ncbi:MAG: lytic transglycosylase domain-containing protein [Burkholderiaceae bacterium]|nr:lytic transglycosylase domain-containing protein [Burkholderiaceae bacterium]
MPFASGLALTQQLASGLYRNMSEFVRTCAIYIGIAVLVAAVMIAGMPSLRSQARQMHGALLVALAPDSFVPVSAVPASPPATLVGAISLDSIPGAVLPPPVVAPPLTVTRTQTDTPSATAAVLTGSTAARPGETEALGALQESPAQAFARMGVSRNQQDALIKYISRKYLIAVEAASMFVDTAYVAGGEQKVDPLLLLAVMATESRFNPYAGSNGGGPTGLMQVVTSVHRSRFARFGSGDAVVFNPVANIRVGALILADCIRRRGSVTQGLLCYCGASGPGADGGYTEKVQSERRRLALAASIPIKD